MKNRVLASTSLWDAACTARKTSAASCRGSPRKPADPPGPNYGAASAGALLAVLRRGRWSPGVGWDGCWERCSSVTAACPFAYAEGGICLGLEAPKRYAGNKVGIDTI